MKQPIKKKITKYILEVNGIPVKEFTGKTARRDIKNYITSYHITEDTKTIDIVRESAVQFIVKSLKPKVTRILVVDDLNDDFFNEPKELKNNEK